MKRDLIWIGVFLALIGILLGIRQLLPGTRGNTAVVLQNGKPIASLPLDEDSVTDFDGPSGYCRLQILAGEVRIMEATCPDGICVKHGPLKQGGTPIVCLPNRLVIRFANEEKGHDAVAGLAR